MTQIRISDLTKTELDLQGHKGESYDTIIKRNINFVKKFSNESQFTEWFKENYTLFGFSNIEKYNPNEFPDFVMLRDGEKVRVELETISSHFIYHGHDASQVDLVICLLIDRKLPVPTVEIEPFKYDGMMNKVCFQVSEEQHQNVKALPRSYNLSEKLRKELDKILARYEAEKAQAQSEEK